MTLSRSKFPPPPSVLVAAAIYAGTTHDLEILFVIVAELSSGDDPGRAGGHPDPPRACLQPDRVTDRSRPVGCLAGGTTLMLGVRCSCCSSGSARVARASSVRGSVAAAGGPATLSGMPPHPGPGDGSADVGLIPQHQDGWQLAGELFPPPTTRPNRRRKPVRPAARHRHADRRGRGQWAG